MGPRTQVCRSDARCAIVHRSSARRAALALSERERSIAYVARRFSAARCAPMRVALARCAGALGRHAALAWRVGGLFWSRAAGCAVLLWAKGARPVRGERLLRVRAERALSLQRYAARGTGP